MFMYLSYLVETGVLISIEVNFLIVGHTHCSIDQYFSVLSRAIKESEFVGSPFAIQYIYQHAHSSNKDNPLVQNFIEVVPDYVKAFAPYLIGKEIAYYGVPHCFIFFLFKTKCVMQYKLFSSFKKWLPEPPDVAIDYEVETVDTVDVSLIKLAVIGGEDLFLQELGLNNVTVNDTLKNPFIKNQQDSFYSMLSTINSINDVTIFQQQRNENLALLGSSNIPKVDLEADFKITTELQIRAECNKNVGFIYWLRSQTRKKEALPSIANFNPEYININNSPKIKTKFENAAKCVVTASRFVLQMVKDKKVRVSDDEEFKANNITDHILTAKEYRFYPFPIPILLSC